jgi:hypothetical protein
MFEFNSTIIEGIYLLSNANFDSKYETRHFQNLISYKLYGKNLKTLYILQDQPIYFF